MNVVDSSGWLEYFSNSKRASLFQKPIEDTKNLIVSVISIYEVFKKLLSTLNEEIALISIAHMQQGKIVDLDAEIAMNEAKISFEYKIPMADSIILATAFQYDATLWTQDEDFKNIKEKNTFQSKCQSPPNK